MARPFFYGWVVVAAAMLGIACSFSVLVISITGIFAAPLSAEFGWSAPQIFLGPTMAGLSVLISAPLTGAMCDRFGVRRLVLTSFAIEVLLLASFGFMNDSILGYWLRYGALACLCMGTTQVVFSRMLSAWFHRRLGRAIGIAFAGTGIGGAVWSLTAQKLIELHGWRHAYLGLALIIACVSLPLLFALLRDTPESLGLHIDGAVTADDGPASVGDGMSLREAARTPSYWLMVVVFMLLGLSLQGVQLHWVPLLTHRGLTAQAAASIQALSLLAVVLGRLSSGWLLDRLFAARVAQLFLLPPLLGVTALALGVSGAWAVIAAMGVGLALGGESDVIAYSVRRYYGLREYSRIYGTLFGAVGVGTALGPATTAWFLAQSHSGYAPVMWTHAGLLSLALLLLFGLKRY